MIVRSEDFTDWLRRRLRSLVRIRFFWDLMLATRKILLSSSVFRSGRSMLECPKSAAELYSPAPKIENTSTQGRTQFRQSAAVPGSGQAGGRVQTDAVRLEKLTCPARPTGPPVAT